jgi:hypothetical protein
MRSKNKSEHASIQNPDPPLAQPSPGDASPIKIRNWSGDADPINDNTLLIRYMKLETFLLLLRRHTVFIPTLKLLQSGDGLEGNISAIAAAYTEKMQPIVGPHRKWLLKAAGSPKIIATSTKARNLHVNALLAESWRKELAKRRCIWCWNRGTEQLNFMWKLYGDRGIAVVSTVGNIRKALADAGGEGIVSPVRYIPWKSSIPQQDWNFLNENYARPHLFKEASYSPEREVRFVLKVNADGTRWTSGVLFNVSEKTILHTSGRIEVSPHIPLIEAHNIQDLIFKHRWPNRQFLPPPDQGNLLRPSVESDLPSGLFPDLD